jgi:hypothetical protein
MKSLSIFLVFIFLLITTTSAQEKKNPLEGTTWEFISLKNVREDTTFTAPNSPYEQAIMIFGKTHYSVVHKDTSRDFSSSSSYTYNVDGDNITLIVKMHEIYETIGKTFNLKFKIEGDQLIINFTDLNFGGYHYKSGHHVWKRID